LGISKQLWQTPYSEADDIDAFSEIANQIIGT
jgi:hypothetical protein